MAIGELRGKCPYSNPKVFILGLGLEWQALSLKSISNNVTIPQKLPTFTSIKAFFFLIFVSFISFLFFSSFFFLFPYIKIYVQQIRESEQQQYSDKHSNKFSNHLVTTPTFLSFGSLLILISTILLVLFGGIIAARVTLWCACCVGLGAGHRLAALHLWTLWAILQCGILSRRMYRLDPRLFGVLRLLKI